MSDERTPQAGAELLPAVPEAAPVLLDRRKLLRDGAAGALGGSVALALLADAADAKKRRRHRRPTNILRNAGVGMYTDPSVAQQISGFTINGSMISCAVGTFQNGTGVPTGAFSMLMYAVKISSLKPHKKTGKLMGQGRMRSITQVGGQTKEDVRHDFIAIAQDGRNGAKDRFDIHFKTPFWDPATNPMATPSKDYPGLARFGGELVMGEINVG